MEKYGQHKAIHGTFVLDKYHRLDKVSLEFVLVILRYLWVSLIDVKVANRSYSISNTLDYNDTPTVSLYQALLFGNNSHDILAFIQLLFRSVLLTPL